MITVIAGALTLALVAGCAWAVSVGELSAFLGRLNPVGRLVTYGVVLVLVASAGWTVGSVAGPADDRPVPVVPVSGDTGDGGGHGHGG